MHELHKETKSKYCDGRILQEHQHNFFGDLLFFGQQHPFDLCLQSASSAKTTRDGAVEISAASTRI